MEPLLSPSNLVGIENVAYLCQGREAPWLSAQASVYENLRDVKVLGMLDDVGAKAKADLAAAVEDFTEASKFCDTTLVEKDYAMKKSKEIIGALEATIFEADAKVKEYEFSVSELSKDISGSNGELAKLTKLREKEHANFLEVEKELVEAVVLRAVHISAGAAGSGRKRAGRRLKKNGPQE